MNQPNTIINVKPAKSEIQLKDVKLTDSCEAIKVELLSAPTFAKLKSYLPEMVSATWEDYPGECTPTSEKDRIWITNEVLHQRTFLPTAAETINLTFRISGLSMQDVTHLIRYRRGSFSAQCTADRFMTEEEFVIPAIIKEKSPELVAKYTECIQKCQDTYNELIKAGVSTLDARYVMPMARSTFYYVRFSYPDVLAFIRARIDRSLQPMSDNVIAYKMYQALLSMYPSTYDIIDVDAPPKFYHKAMNTYYCSNFYPPEDMHNVDYDPNNFIYGPREWPESFMKVYDEVKYVQKRAQDAWNDYIDSIKE